MAKAKAAPAPAEPIEGDRVVMLSMRADGTPDQRDPVLIGDEESIAVETEKLG